MNTSNYTHTLATETGLPRQWSLTVILTVLVLLMFAISLAWFIQYENDHFYETHQTLAASSGLGVARTLHDMVQNKRDSVSSLVDHEGELLRDLAQFPADEEKLARLKSAVSIHTPDSFNYLLAGPEGNPLMQEKMLKMGPNCLQNIQLFSQTGQRPDHTMVLHNSGKEDAHFDVMANLEENTNGPVLFVSFRVDAIIEVLLNARIPQQTILIVQHANPERIEMSSEGVYQSPFGSQLSSQALRSALYQKHIENSGWRVLVIPASNLFTQNLSRLMQRALLAFFAVLLILSFFLWRLWLQEKSRRMAQKALQHSYRLMENRVKQRTDELSISEENLRNTFMSAPFGMLVIDENGIIESANELAEQIFYYQQDELKGQYVETLLPQRFRDHHQHFRAQFNLGRDAETMGKGRFLSGLRKNGQEFPIEVGLSRLRHSTGNKVIASVSDVSEVTRLQEQLMEQHELAVVTLNSIADGVITTDIDGEIISINAVAERLCGWSKNDALGRPIHDVFHVIHEKTRERVDDPVMQCLRHKAIVDVDAQTVLIHKKGMDIPIEDNAAPIRNANGEIIGAVLVFHDVSQSRAHANEIEYQANHDALTGLINRREFDSRLENMVRQAHRTGSNNILLFMDLDRFKRVNDTAGHAAGDDLLIKLTKLLAGKLRQRDTLARLGGDEFAVLLEHCSNTKGLEVANKLRQSVESFRFFWKEQVFSVGVSIGMVSFSEDSQSADDLLSEADAACYTAKEAGRNRVHVYDARAALKRTESSIVNMLEEAFEGGGMQLFQQRIKAADETDTTEHFELLLRMQTRSGEILSPGMFLPAAERYGLATTLDRWVVRTSFEWLQNNQAQFDNPLLININLSAQSITDTEFREFIRQQFAQFSIDSASICFEITETAAMNNLENARDFIIQLKQQGCRFALDDFGSGHASYAHLKHLPVDFLKIDGQFVKDISQDKINLSIVKSVNDIGHALGLKTIAEFVEDDEIASKLNELGVDYLQGFGIARPEPLHAMLANHQARRSSG